MTTLKKLGALISYARLLFCRRKQPVQESFPLTVFLEIIPQRLSFLAMDNMITLVALLQRAEFPITVGVLKGQVPDGYIGRMTVRNGDSGAPLKCWLLPYGYFDQDKPPVDTFDDTIYIP